ncbi:NAD(P)/FAD-dependent oxidoreductase [Lichenicola sp.]|uniref:NAD(P)/FAD-dependent oxidoreductase n=1 Tax=Lichenicola sp. TaxID=2804529 RepID=UPI003AFFCCA2
MTVDVAIIGGGLAGASLAAQTAAQGRRVVLIEREAGPHDKVCGEFLSHEAQQYLQALGIDPLALGGSPIDRVRLAAGGGVAEIMLPFKGVGLTRRTLDEVLLARAADAGATVLRGRAASTLTARPGGQRIQLQGGEVIDAGQAVLATGKHEMRGWKRGRGRQNDLVGFKQHFRLAPGEADALEGAVELMLFRGGYAGLQLVEGRQATLCLLVRCSVLARLAQPASQPGAQWPAVLAAAARGSALFRRRLQDAAPVQPRPLSIAGIPYGYVAPDVDPGAEEGGVWRLGDQSAVIPSFTGDGMSIALHSAALAAGLLQAGGGPEMLQAAMRRDVGRQVAGASVLSLTAVHRLLQRPFVSLARSLPMLAAAIAAGTRIPDHKVQRALRSAPQTIC